MRTVQKLLYFDCFSGASGDMFLGALLDAGLPLDALRHALGSLAIDDLTIDARRVLRAGVSSTKFIVHDVAGEGRPAGHAHDHGHIHGDAESHDHAHDHDRGHRHQHDDPHDHLPVHEPAHSHAPHPHGGAHAHTHDQPIADQAAAHAAGHLHGTSHQHHHASHAHGHRSLAEIEALIGRSGLSASARSRAVALFRRLAEAEAAIHDMPLERVHLHEVGALDSIVDIVGSVFAMEWFGADRIVASAVNVGSGTVQCAHGRFPVPAPATARLLRDVPIYQAGPAMELTTPTGALLITGFADAFGPIPEMLVDRIGYGAGDRDVPGHPNVLRVLVGRTADAGATPERVSVLEFEVDDMNPQLYGALMDALLAAGAHDVFYTPVQMKKNRPGTLVTIITTPDRRERLSELVFRETTTLGLRYHDVLRECLLRDEQQVETPWGAVRVKLARLGSEIVNAAPEYEDCLRAARAHGVPVKDVHAAAVKAWLDTRS